ncbi:integrase [Egibacter rhizosphaerae]|uniref:Integrase n=1 Tax=Egibacter rhizosphaerae TaxID=1670831 RepID=A0A411YIK4_9ACTN|nr:tyrosine-type recombinase/integrase [Egibacter rhizosphaerae]QBI21027.1 integrase [Egibacter rhizosphaerae]
MSARASALTSLLSSWELSLRAANRSERTIEAYRLAVRQLAEYLDDPDATEVGRADIEAFLAHVLSNRSPATARQRYLSLGVFFRWLVEEEEIDASPMAKVKAPHVPEQPVPVVSDDHFAALLKACQGKQFPERRDTAILRLFYDTGSRLGEVAGLELDHLDLTDRVVHVLGKGKRGRSTPFGIKTAQALDRYLRARARHKAADTPWLWLGDRGPMTPSGISQMLKRRCAEAGIEPLNPHRFRHTFAHQWLANGGQEQDLMRLAGWRSPQMLSRYGASAADERARDAYRNRSPGDKF